MNGSRDLRSGATFDRTACGGAVRWWVGLGVIGMLLGLPGAVTAAENVFRIGFSRGALGEVSQHDAMAALKGWALGIAHGRGLDVEVAVQFFEDQESIPQALAAGEIHALTLSAEEMFRNRQQPDQVLLQVRNGSWSTRYSVLVRQESGISALSELKAGTVAVHRRAGSGMGEIWLRHELRKSALELPVSRFSPQPNANKAVLRVYFKQDAACLVEAGVFEIACELNPQLRKGLRVLTTSPDFVPQAFFYLPSFRGALRDAVDEAIQALHGTVAGRQVMQVFQGERMEQQPLSVMNETFRYLQEALPEVPRPKEGGSP